MKNDLLMNFSVDKENKKILVEREFAAPLANVWSAWTESEILDKWWAPKPWKARTKTMDFSVGGYWLYAMVGPEGEEHWARADYEAITPLKSYSAEDAFCDKNGKINTDFPRSIWTNRFTEKSDKTLVSIEIKYKQLSDLETTIEMGFKEGFTAGMENLDELLS
ncbi:SRPBCC family protein [Dyadobacter psychrotolerans]|uniref:SRPBCC domain-containing protein n=1 Tax=Dyadobacter psychrotolerans TaxID=2541721 RepID=A0A4V2Z3J7_9BACT|nr:SRPBCC domain-containing protein [Dyadobacter psychrotolerans]TDE12828.1 SRPBCC domain-containing protein [Dyadobacter psychrotolerans]